MKLTARTLRPAQQRAEQRRTERRSAMLARMSPMQRVQALKQESAFKAGQERKQDDKTLRTKGIVGTKAEREAFREEKRGIQRERALERMTPEQREQALKQESEFKTAEAAKVKKAEDAKALRTVAVVGDKEERQAFRAKKKSAQRDRALDAMEPDEREQALKREAEAKAAQAAEQKAKDEENLRRTVAIVGDEAKRQRFREAKQALRRDDILAAATPEQRAQLLEQEAAFKAAEAAKAQQEQREKSLRTVAIVGDKTERAAFGRSTLRGTPTTFETSGLSLSRSELEAELSRLRQEVALLS